MKNKDKISPITQPSVRINPVIKSGSSHPIISTKKNSKVTVEAEIGLAEISEKTINDKWAEIINILQNKYPRVYNGIKKATFTLVDDNIVLHVKSEPLKKSIEERLSIITKHAQKVLNNKNIHFVFEVKEVKNKEKSLYLAKDKYKFYLEKNKNIEKLVELFNLDL